MTAERDAPWEHDFLPVKGHPDDDECTYRSEGTDATYCGRTRAEHEEHDPRCYQSTGVPDDLPGDLCDCRVLRVIDTARDFPPEPHPRAHEFDPGYTGMSEACNRLVLRDGYGDDCDLPREHPTHRVLPPADAAAGEDCSDWRSTDE